MHNSWNIAYATDRISLLGHLDHKYISSRLGIYHCDITKDSKDPQVKTESQHSSHGHTANVLNRYHTDHGGATNIQP